MSPPFTARSPEAVILAPDISPVAVRLPSKVPEEPNSAAPVKVESPFTTRVLLSSSLVTLIPTLPLLVVITLNVASISGLSLKPPTKKALS